MFINSGNQKSKVLSKGLYKLFFLSLIHISTSYLIHSFLGVRSAPLDFCTMSEGININCVVRNRGRVTAHDNGRPLDCLRMSSKCIFDKRHTIIKTM